MKKISAQHKVEKGDIQISRPETRNDYSIDRSGTGFKGLFPCCLYGVDVEMMSHGTGIEVRRFFLKSHLRKRDGSHQNR